MEYAVPRKSRARAGMGGEHADASVSASRTPARPAHERARELQQVLEASGFSPGTPRRVRAAIEHAGPTSSTPLTPRRMLRPYAEAGPSAPRVRPPSVPTVQQRVAPMAILELSLIHI